MCARRRNKRTLVPITNTLIRVNVATGMIAARGWASLYKGMEKEAEAERTELIVFFGINIINVTQQRADDEAATRLDS